MPNTQTREQLSQTPPPTLGRTLRAQRILAGVSAEQLAQVLECSDETIRRIERLTDEVPEPLVVKYMAALHAATEKA